MTTVVFASVVLLLIVAGCGPAGRDVPLLDDMPPGYDIYVVLDTQELGMDELLGSLEDSGLLPGSDLDMVGAVLGFEPLDWAGWVEFFDLSEGRLGLVIGMDRSGEPEVVALYLPSGDPEGVEAKLRELVPSEAGLAVFESGSHTVVALAESDDSSDDFRRDCGSETLSADDEGYASARNLLELDGSGVTVFARLPEEEPVRMALLSLVTDGPSISYEIVAEVDDPDFREIATALEATGPSGDFVVLEEAFVAARFSFDMTPLAELASAEAPPDAMMGVAMLGFESVEELLSIFSGDVVICVSDLHEFFTGAIAIGLADEEAGEQLLESLTALAGMGGPGGLESFEHEGSTAYRIDADGTLIEAGIFGGALYVTVDASLEQLAEGPDLVTYISRLGIDGITDDCGAIMVAGSGSRFADLVDLEFASALEGMEGLHVRLQVSGGLLYHSGARLTSGEDASVEMIGIATAAAEEASDPGFGGPPDGGGDKPGAQPEDQKSS